MIEDISLFYYSFVFLISIKIGGGSWDQNPNPITEVNRMCFNKNTNCYNEIKSNDEPLVFGHVIHKINDFECEVNIHPFTIDSSSLLPLYPNITHPANHMLPPSFCIIMPL